MHKKKQYQTTLNNLDVCMVLFRNILTRALAVARFYHSHTLVRVRNRQLAKPTHSNIHFEALMAGNAYNRVEVL